MKWDKIAGVRRELKKMAGEAMGREYIFSVTFACMMNLIMNKRCIKLQCDTWK